MQIYKNSLEMQEKSTKTLENVNKTAVLLITAMRICENTGIFCISWYCYLCNNTGVF
jgi:hypothetical protein